MRKWCANRRFDAQVICGLSLAQTALLEAWHLAVVGGGPWGAAILLLKTSGVLLSRVASTGNIIFFGLHHINEVVVFVGCVKDRTKLISILVSTGEPLLSQMITCLDVLWRAVIK